MATSSSVHTNTYGGRTITLLVEEISTSIENNTSTIKWTLSSGTSSTYHSVYDITAWVNGTASSNKVYGPKTADWSTRAFPCKDGSTSGTLTIPHNADGTASPVTFRLRGSVYNNNPQNYDGSIDLTTIPRASSFTISGGTIGSTISVSITRASNDFTHKVYCTYGNKTQIISNDAGTSASATLDMDFCNYVTTSPTASATMYVETYSSGTYVGTSSLQFTMSVPNSVLPTISSVTKSDTSNLLATYGAYVQSKSNLRVQTTASGSYSSTISSIVVNTKDSNNNIIRTLNGSDVTFIGVNYVGTATIEVIATDSRGRQATNTSTINIAGYSNPSISYFTAERLNNDSTVTLTFSSSITNINNANVNGKSFKIYKRQKGTSSWGSAITTYTSSYTYSSNNYTTSCDANYGWEFKFETTDSFTTSSNDSASVGTAFELINWGADGTSMAIGKVSEHSNTLEIALPTELSNDFYNNAIDLFQDTSGSNWADMMKNKIDYCIANINTSKTNAMVFINGGWQNVNWGYGLFSKIDEYYQLVWISIYGVFYVRKINGNYEYSSFNANLISIPNNDLDYATDNGTYNYDRGAINIANCPTSDGIHILKVQNNGSSAGDWLVQEDYVLRWGASSTEKYIRIKTAGGWSNWQRII